MRILILYAVLSVTASAACAGPPRGSRYQGVVTNPRTLRCGQSGMFVNPKIYVKTGPNKWAYRNGDPGTLSVGPQGRVTVNPGTRPTSRQSSRSVSSSPLMIQNPYFKKSTSEKPAHRPQTHRAKGQ